MPSGYTEGVMNGKITEVEDYATLCARAFGAFMHQRDESWSTGLRMPDANEDTYHAKALAKAQDEYERWHDLSEEERYAEWSEYAVAQETRLHELLAKNALTRARYEAMIAKIVPIEAPSTHQEFKNFMIEQLKNSIDFDCGKEGSSFERDYYRVQSYSEWCDSKDKSVLKDVFYHQDKLREDKERNESRIEYIRVMRDVFGIKVSDE